MTVSPERIEEALERISRFDGGVRRDDLVVVLAALREAQAENRALKDAREAVEHREGVVEVYDWQGVYLGCMGIETWQAALAPADEAKHTQECDDHAFVHHAATGGDAECICRAPADEAKHE